MRKFISDLVLFGLFTAIFYFFALFIWGIYSPSIIKSNLNYEIGSYGHMHSRLKEAKKIRDVDILFLGSSHAYRELDPRLFKDHGLSSFNLGSSNQTPVQTKILLKRYLNQITPKLIIYDVFPGTFSVDGVESSLDIIANDKNDIYSLQMVLELNHPKAYNTLLYGVARDLLGLNSSFVESRIKGDDSYITGGYVEKDLQLYKKYNLIEEDKWNFNQKQFNYFNEVIEMIKKRKIDLILVNAPIPASAYNSFSNNEVFDDLIDNYSEYYNFNKILHLNDSLHFYDSNHLNQNGVKIYNKELLKILDERYRKNLSR